MMKSQIRLLFAFIILSMQKPLLSSLEIVSARDEELTVSSVSADENLIDLLTIDLNDNDSQEIAQLSIEELVRENVAGTTSLQRACKEREVDSVKLVLKRLNDLLKNEPRKLKEFIAKPDRHGNSALQIALKGNHQRIIFILLAFHPRITIKDLELALEHCNEEVCVALINAGADKLIIGYNSEECKGHDSHTFEAWICSPTEAFDKVFAQVKKRRFATLEEHLRLIKDEGMNFPMIYAMNKDVVNYKKYYRGHLDVEKKSLLESLWNRVKSAMDDQPRVLSFEERMRCVDKKGRSALWYASCSNSVELCRYFVKFLTNDFIDVPFLEQNSVCVAAKQGNLEVLQFFMRRFSSYSRFASLFGSALYEASVAGQVKIVKEIVGKNPELIDYKLPESPTALIVSAAGNAGYNTGSQENHFAICELLIGAGASVTTKSNEDNKQDALFRAAKYGNLSVCVLLLDNGAHVNTSCDPEAGYLSPLQVACLRGHRDVCYLLIAHGAKTDFLNKKGVTPLVYAIEGGLEDVAFHLIEKGARLEIPALKKDGRTLSNCAAAHGMVRLSATLRNHYKEKGLSIPCNKKGITDLMILAWAGHAGGIAHLCADREILAKIDEQDHLDNSALMYAASGKDLDAFLRLLDAGAEPNLQRKRDGLTALMLLAQNKKVSAQKKAKAEYATIFTARGGGRTPVRLNTRNKNNQTALTIAAKNGNLELCRAFIEADKEFQIQQSDVIEACEAALENDHEPIALYLSTLIDDFAVSHRLFNRYHTRTKNNIPVNPEEIDDVKTEGSVPDPLSNDNDAVIEESDDPDFDRDDK